MSRQGVILLPLLAIYLVLIFLFNQPLEGDELRYISYAQNLAHGFFTDSSNPDLSNGPGYPLVLLPFVALNISLLVPKILNGIFVFIGVLYFYKTLRLYTLKRKALIFTYIIGLYPPLLKWMALLYSESLAFMLMSGFIYYFCSLHRGKGEKWKNSIIASFFLGYLVLTKVIFFHVINFGAILLFILFLLRKRTFFRWSLFVFFGAIICTTPYIVYAFSVTGKLFYLGTRGGELLYYRSTPFENEWGDWFSPDLVLDTGQASENTKEVYLDLSELSANHRDFFVQIHKLSNIEKDSALKAKAISNMKEHPVKYLKNTLSNIGRLLFNYPTSYRSQDLSAYGYFIPNMFIIVLLTLIAYPAFLSRRRIPFEITAMLIFVLIYGCALIVLTGKPRYFIMMVPALLLFLIYSYTILIKITIVKPKELK